MRLAPILVVAPLGAVEVEAASRAGGAGAIVVDEEGLRVDDGLAVDPPLARRLRLAALRGSRQLVVYAVVLDHGEHGGVCRRREREQQQQQPHGTSWSGVPVRAPRHRPTHCPITHAPGPPRPAGPQTTRGNSYPQIN